MASKNGNKATWKIYGVLILLVAAVSLSFTALTAFVMYPTSEHRQVGKELATLDSKSISSGNYKVLAKSDKYKELASSYENTYTTRMGIGSSILNAVISVSIVVALYRYLRRNQITPKPIRVTVLVDTAAMAIMIIPSMYIGQLITGIQTEPFLMVMLLISAPFAVAFNALIAFVIARFAEWHYNRSQDSVE